MTRRMLLLALIGAFVTILHVLPTHALPEPAPGSGTFSSTGNGEGGTNTDADPDIDGEGALTIKSVWKNGVKMDPETYTKLNDGTSQAKVRFHSAPSTTDSIEIKGETGNAGHHTGTIEWSAP